MTEIADRFERIAGHYEQLLVGCPSQAWSATSPCEDWSARALAEHVNEVARGMLARLDEGAADRAGKDAGGDVLAEWRELSASLNKALGDPEQAGSKVTTGFGEQRWDELIGGVLCADVLIHSWDFARATGQDERLDPGAVKAASAFLTPNDEMRRQPGGFGPKVSVAVDADEQTKLLAFTGRRAE
jgi:uncharacterized protein (TIGR03086 family)